MNLYRRKSDGEIVEAYTVRHDDHDDYRPAWARHPLVDVFPEFNVLLRDRTGKLTEASNLGFEDEYERVAMPSPYEDPSLVDAVVAECGLPADEWGSAEPEAIVKAVIAVAVQRGLVTPVGDAN